MIAKWRLGLFLIVVAFLIIAPMILQTYPKLLLTEMLIFGLFAASIDLLAGMVNRVTLGHGAIFGVAAYIVAWCQLTAGLDVWTAAALGIFGASLLALLFGFLSVRTSGVYFMLLTLALGMVVWGVAYRWVSVTGSESGLRGINRPAILQDHDDFYWFVLVVVGIVFALLRLVARSQFGLTLRAIRESPQRMSTLGYHVPMALTLVLLVSGLAAGVAGVLDVWLNNFVSPTSVSLDRSVEGLLMAILGGVGTLWGGFLGAVVIIGLENLVSFYTERWTTVLGLLFIFTVLFAPNGLLGLFGRNQKSNG
ncbi:Branched-chain amino acid transport system permease protein OS=Castellaniella defragrans OX=75697 GN=HNR28_002445 PE=4 SV=1 [Castellaniella defragrans]